MSHTPGPWKLSKVEIGFYVSGTDNKYLADVHGWVGRDENEPETASNARLIAAAPEMLEILEELYDRYGDDDPLHHRTANIIQKAKGE